MNSFMKGAATGLLVGSAVALITIPMGHRKTPKKRVSSALRAMSDIIEDIGDVFKG